MLRGIFTLRRCELEWYYQHGASLLFPDKWERFLAPIPEAERGDLIAAYRKRLIGSDRVREAAAARAWSLWEGETITLLPDPSASRSTSTRTTTPLAFARIENHYFVHAGWLEEGQLHPRRRAAARTSPASSCRAATTSPARRADGLGAARAWPEAEFRLVEGAGHAYSEPRHPATS